jgi:hypothetical protein
MYREQLPITALPAWSKLNEVSFLDIKVQDLGGSKGFGLVTERNLSSKDTFDIPTLLIIPNDLILSAEAVKEHGKVDQHFRQLLDAAGGKVSLGAQMSHSIYRDIANGRAVFERRCSSVPLDANHHWVTKPGSECGLVNGLDGVCEDAT